MLSSKVSLKVLLGENGLFFGRFFSATFAESLLTNVAAREGSD